MQQKKLVGLILLVISVFIISVNVYANNDTVSCCDSNTKVIEELHNELIQKRNDKLNDGPNYWNSEFNISPFSLINSVTYLTPSTGDVRILVLPIEFSDTKFSQSQLESIEPTFFEKDDANVITNLSVVEAYNRLSYGKLNMSGNVLPVYSAPENKDYYSDNTSWNNLIEEAITSYTDIDFSQYDGDSDGYIDIFFVEIANNPGVSGEAWGSYATLHKIDLPDGMKIASRAQVTTYTRTSTSVVSSSEVHEIGHLLGLPDNYSAYGYECALDKNLNEIMSQYGAYFNVYYKYLLEWISEEDGTVTVLTYDDILDENILEKMELYAVEKNNNFNAETTKAIFLIPNKAKFPFDECYAVEYRVGGAGGRSEGIGGDSNDDKGILLWHLDTSTNQYGNYNKPGNFIQPVYKSGEKPFETSKDLYVTGDIFSSDTNPSSNFYNDVYTGAYLKVLDIDNEKATVEVGFKDPDLNPAPSITIGKPSRKYVRRYKYPTIMD
ncbi:MAG: hypothetical protein J1F01_07545, partial [Oscillospiraceae bacterium]|nr:hypothetical protein [Oscillospiraceae bacterium]